MRQSGKVGRVPLQRLRHSAAHDLAEPGLAPLAGIEGVPERARDEPVVEDERGYAGLPRSRLRQLPLQAFLGLADEGHLEVVGEKGEHEVTSSVQPLPAHVVTVVLLCVPDVSRDQATHHVTH